MEDTALAYADATSMQTRLNEVKAEWFASVRPAAPNPERFRILKQEADEIIQSGRWVSGPDDLMSVLGRQRDEVMHSRVISWLLRPTGRHGLGSRFLDALVDYVWPGEEPLRSALVTVDTETTRAAADDAGESHEARADIVVYGDNATILIENKVDAGEGIDQCERLYWSWADQPTETRWLFLSPSGRPPVTAVSAEARSAWRTIGSWSRRGLRMNRFLERIRDCQVTPTGRDARHALADQAETREAISFDHITVVSVGDR